jgi:hypothetical protein
MEKLNVEFRPATKLVVVTATDEGFHLKQYQGRKAKGEASIEVNEETDMQGVKELIEEFRAM